MRHIHHRHHRELGQGLLEGLTVLALVGTMTAVTLPAVQNLRREAALQRAARIICGLIVRGRALSVARGRAMALVFERDAGRWRCFLAEDGDGDGVNRVDLRSGRDTITGEVHRLASGGAGPGILAGEPVPDPSGHGVLRGDLEDPIRAGRGDIITLKAGGTATPGSIYLSDGHSRMRVIRIYGATARVRQMVWRRGWPRWKRAGW